MTWKCTQLLCSFARCLQNVVMYQQLCRRRSWWNCRRGLHLGWSWICGMMLGLIRGLEFLRGIWRLRFWIFQFLRIQMDRKRGCLCQGKDGNFLESWGIRWRGACGLGLGLEIRVRVKVSRGVRDGDRGYFKGRHLTCLDLFIRGCRCTIVANIIWESELVILFDWFCTGLWVGVGRCVTNSVGLF